MFNCKCKYFIFNFSLLFVCHFLITEFMVVTIYIPIKRSSDVVHKIFNPYSL